MHSAARPSASTQPLSSTSWSDTTNAIPLTSSPIHGALPAWSPDGSQIAFMGTPKGKSARIYLIARDGGEPKPVPPDTLWPLAPLASEHWLGGPTWSPDGKQIAIGENGDHFPLSPVCAIHIFHLDTQILSTIPQSEGLWSARWSPAGGRSRDFLNEGWWTRSEYRDGKCEWRRLETAGNDHRSLQWRFACHPATMSAHLASALKQAERAAIECQAAPASVHRHRGRSNRSAPTFP